MGIDFVGNQTQCLNKREDAISLATGESQGMIRLISVELRIKEGV